MKQYFRSDLVSILFKILKSTLIVHKHMANGEKDDILVLVHI